MKEKASGFQRIYQQTQSMLSNLLQYLPLPILVTTLLLRHTRRPHQIKCITFDLDDTIWKCQPVIERAADVFYAYLQSNFPAIIQLYPTKTEWRHLSSTIVKENPDKKHDLTLIRKLCLERAAKQAQLNPAVVVEPAYQAFIDSRNNVSDQLFPEALNVLAAIQRQGIQMGAVSNGNAEMQDIPCLRDYFDFAVHPGTAGAKKPDMAPFQQALHLSKATVPLEMIHVGDSLISDVHAAQEFGCARSVWIKTGSVWSGTSPSLMSKEQLALGRGDVELTDLSQLLDYLVSLGVLKEEDAKGHV